MATKGYQSYRGRMPGWKKLLILILVIILLCAGAFLVLQPDQIFDADGSRFQLPLVGENDVAPSSDEEELGDDLIIDIQEPAAKITELYGCAIDAAGLQDEDFSALGEGERPVLTVKAANDTVLYGSINDAAADLVREKIAGRDAVARISCFADTQRADADNALAVMSVSGKAWRDPDGNAWLDPYSAAVTAYLVGIVRECADLGFTEIVLDDVQFPNYGRTDRVTYASGTDTPENRIQAINAFLDAAYTALDGRDVALSVSLPAELITAGSDDVAGWDLAEIVQRVDRVYVSVADQAQADSVRASLAALRTDVDGACFFVAQTSAPVTGGSYVIG